MKANFTEWRKIKSTRLTNSVRGILFSMLLVIMGAVKLNAQPYVNFVFNPAVTNATVGQNITVQVVAQFTAASPMDACQINFTFNPAILNATAISNISSLTSIIGPTFNNSTGEVNFVGADLSAPFPNADFAVLSISFDVLAVPGGGSTTLSFNRPPTEAASGGSSVLNTTTNGTVNITAVGCTPPTASIRAGATCDAQPFNLILNSSPAPTGTAPFDLTIAGPTGTFTYNDIPVGGIITNFTPPTTRIWPAAPAPLPPTSEDASVTLGVRFQSSVAGFVKGIRFFCPDEVGTGTFTGQLWNGTGTLLGTGTFTGVTADSWNEFSFTNPIPITANTTYVASYHTTAIKYTSTSGGLTGSVTNAPLTALAGGGVYAYGATSAFPGNATANNYWADVMFSASDYTFNLTSVKDALECTNSGALQTLSVTSVDCSTLPVSLLNFSASPKENSVVLRWVTTSEINNLGFELQRSIDGNNGWTPITFINGAGNSTSTINYSYVDENLTARRYYYRLKQVDIDRRFVYSPIVSVQLNAKGTYALEQNYPNPFRYETIIRYSLPHKAKVNISLFDINGRLVKVLVSESRDSGTHAVSLQSGALKTGLYYYKMQADEFTAVRKLTIH